jgi:membrane associated rhomboid family serine protease
VEEGAPPTEIVRGLTDGKPTKRSWGLRYNTLLNEAWPVGALTLLLWVIALAQIGSDAFGLGWNGAMLNLGALGASSFRFGYWWTPLTNMFLHTGPLHILMNSSALVSLGPALAFRFGRDLKGAGLFWAFFVLCGLAGSALYLALLWTSDSYAVGASGAICGLWGGVARLTAEGGLAPIVSRQVGKQTQSFIVMNLVLVAIGFGIGVMSGAGGLMIAWEAHVGGFIAGLFLIQVFPTRYPRSVVEAA